VEENNQVYICNNKIFKTMIDKMFQDTFTLESILPTFAIDMCRSFLKMSTAFIKDETVKQKVLNFSKEKWIPVVGFIIMGFIAYGAYIWFTKKEKKEKQKQVVEEGKEQKVVDEGKGAKKIQNKKKKNLKSRKLVHSPGNNEDEPIVDDGYEEQLYDYAAGQVNDRETPVEMAMAADNIREDFNHRYGYKVKKQADSGDESSESEDELKISTFFDKLFDGLKGGKEQATINKENDLLEKNENENENKTVTIEKQGIYAQSGAKNIFDDGHALPGFYVLYDQSTIVGYCMVIKGQLYVQNHLLKTSPSIVVGKNKLLVLDHFTVVSKQTYTRDILEAKRSEIIVCMKPKKNISGLKSITLPLVTYKEIKKKASAYGFVCPNLTMFAYVLGLH
jgi:hypothetical protein